MSRLRDPFAFSVVVLMTLTVGGLVTFFLTWRGIAAESSVSRQVPFLVSGGLGGLALVGLAVGLLSVQSRRWAAAQARSDLEEVVRAASALVLAARDDSRERDR